MSKEYRKLLGEQWKATGKNPEYKIYYDEFYGEEKPVEIVEEIVEEIVKPKKEKKK